MAILDGKGKLLLDDESSPGVKNINQAILSKQTISQDKDEIIIRS
jgi:hypothetical protein